MIILYCTCQRYEGECHVNTVIASQILYRTRKNVFIYFFDIFFRMLPTSYLRIPSFFQEYICYPSSQAGNANYKSRLGNLIIVLGREHCGFRYPIMCINKTV